MAQPASLASEPLMHSPKPSKPPFATNPTYSRQAQKPSWTKEFPFSTSNKDSDWKPNGMDINIFLQEPNHSTDFLAESSEPKHMEEEPESIGVGDLDIFSLE